MISLSYQQALNTILDKAHALPSVSIQAHLSLGYCLASNLLADMPSPPFNKSSMDGYACRLADIDKPMHVLSTIFAGAMAEKPVEPGTCYKIMTGAPIPQNADCVVMQEDTETIDASTIKYLNANTKKNICYLGEDYQSGSLLLAKGTHLQPASMPMVAASGKSFIDVFAKPTVGIIATGSEIVEPDTFPPTGKIRNTNSIQLCSQLQAMGITPNYYGIAADNPQQIAEMLAQSVQHNSCTILTGGVSVGEADLVADAIKSIGFTIHVEKTAIQPGRPMLFASNKNHYIFGLSGNPVSSFLQFEYYAKPFLFEMQGHNFEPNVIQLKIGDNYSRRRADTLFLHPATFAGSEVKALSFNGSAHIFAFAQAKGILEIPVGVTSIKVGELVNVRLI